jgi:hypothetical protein
MRFTVEKASCTTSERTAEGTQRVVLDIPKGVLLEMIHALTAGHPDATIVTVALDVAPSEPVRCPDCERTF